MTKQPTPANNVSRRRIIKAGAAAGAFAIIPGHAAADHDEADGTQGGHCLVREGHYIPDEPFTLRFETDFDKPRNCQDENAPDTNWACYTMNYVESGIITGPVTTGFDFEVRPEADHVDGPMMILATPNTSWVPKRWSAPRISPAIGCRPHSGPQPNKTGLTLLWVSPLGTVRRCYC